MSIKHIGELRFRALCARDLAVTVFDKQLAANLTSYAMDLEAEASKLEAEIAPQATLDGSAQEAPAGIDKTGP